MSASNNDKVTSSTASKEVKSQQTQEQREKRNTIYTESLKSISAYFGVSDTCALYLFHRSFRSRRKDDQRLDWSVQLQNALVKADRCVGINWDKVYFGYEDSTLEQHGIITSEMPETVFRWPVEDERVAKEQEKAATTPDDNGWTTVSNKKRRRSPKVKYSINLIRRPGLLI